MGTQRDDEHLRHVVIRAGKHRFALQATPDEQGRVRSLASEAIRWGYVLRARERWADNAEARARHEQDAQRTLAAFGLGEQARAALAEAEQVVVHMAYERETVGWAGRIFPWEYVIAAATRSLRGGRRHPFAVMRELVPASGPLPQKLGTNPAVLVVQSAPGRLQEAWTFDEELNRLRRGLGGIEPVVLKNPTLERLAQEVADLRPALVHLTGFDNVQGLRALRELAGPQTLVDVMPGALEGVDINLETEPVTLTRLLRDERALQDGYLMASEAGRPCIVSAYELAQALKRRDSPPALISVSIANSAPRTAALLVGEGAARSAIGFLGEVDNSLADYFFELLFGHLMQLRGDVATAFVRTWDRARLEPNARRATGIALWSSWNLDLARAPAAPAAAPARPPGDPAVHAQPARELNYAVLHNSDQGLFTEFVVDRNSAPTGSRIATDVELQLGMETARYSSTFVVGEQDDRWTLTDKIHVPLTAGLVRSVREAVTSSLTVQLRLDDKVLTRQSHPVRLLPVDQWRDNAKDGQWLPSFVLPRDPAVMGAVQQAQRYVRVLRDDPTAGFEGYQVAASDPPTEQELVEVDLQVQAIWSALLHEWKLGYINPPPTYSSQLDSQRLRTPSTVRRHAAGTCIDLALTLAACLELVDIYPVIFLLEGHALPGYWRHHSFHERFIEGVFKESDAGVPANAMAGSSAEIQKYPWQTLGREAHRELAARIRARELVPIETVRLTENTGFVEAIAAGIEALAHPRDFHSLLDIVQARQNGVTPLPVVEVES